MKEHISSPGVFKQSGDKLFIDEDLIRLLDQLYGEDPLPGGTRRRSLRDNDRPIREFLDQFFEVLWNRRDFQAPIAALRKRFGLSPEYGKYGDPARGDKAYDQFHFGQRKGRFPPGWEEEVSTLTHEMIKAGLFKGSSYWETFVSNFAYFGCVNVHPELPSTDLDESEYFQIPTKNGIRAFRYKKTGSGVMVEFQASTSWEDMRALFSFKRFNELRGSSYLTDDIKRRRARSYENARNFRQLAVCLDRFEELEGGSSSSNAVKVLDFIQRSYPEFYARLFSTPIHEDAFDGKSPIAEFYKLKKRAKQYGFLDK